jgi:hypothetical protein
MNAPLTDDVLVVLTTAPALQEPVVDWLLEHLGGGGFTGVPVAGHSSRLEGLSADEQVSGRQRRYQFQIQMDVERVEGFLAGLGEAFSGADIRYWMLPVVGAGSLRGSG